VEAKFGLFIHWGLYSVHAKNDNHPYVSWAMEKEGISVDEYSEYAKKFDPQKFDPARWMQIAKKAGMKYVVFTSKHHEGFSIYESEHSSYTSEKTAAKSDMARQIVDAARDAGLKVGLYYSFLDWYHPLYDDDLDAYVTEFAHRQVEEICTLFGPIDVVWFDGEWDHPHQTWHAEELVRTIRRLQPGAVINDRLGAEERGKTPLADFFTREQPSEFSEKADFESTRSLWEACMTIGKSWGYRHDDGPWLDADELIRTLVDVACRGGNFLLNVGPTPDGEIPPHLIERLEGIGEWMSKNGESIYGTYGLTIADQKCTAKGASLYVHLEDRPSGDLVLTGLKNSIKRAFVLSTGEKLAVDDSVKSIALPNVLPDEAVKTIALDLDGDQVRA
jgi:alpha-L-fucosidase